MGLPYTASQIQKIDHPEDLHTDRLESRVDQSPESADEHSETKVLLTHSSPSSQRVALSLSSKKRKRNGINSLDNGAQLLNNLQLLAVRNGVEVKGHVVRISHSNGGSETRAVVLLDLYLPSFLWSGRNYWKPNHAFTAVMDHLRYSCYVLFSVCSVLLCSLFY